MIDVGLYAGIYEHIPNCCSAHITCNLCLDNGKDPNCIICGPTRHKIWCGPDIDPLEELTYWLLKGFDNKYRTLVYAHYGGKFVSNKYKIIMIYFRITILFYKDCINKE